MPETFDLDDGSYDPLGVNTPAEPPAAPATPPASVQPPTTATGVTGAPTVGAPRPPSARPPGTGSVRPPGTGSIRPGTGSIPSRHGTGSISGGTGAPTSRPTSVNSPTSQTGIPAHTKASDLLRGHPNYKAQESSDNRPTLPALTAERMPTKADDFVRPLLTIALIATACCLLYYFYGLFSGQLSKEIYGTFSHDDKARIIANLDTTHTVMTWSLLIAVAGMIFLFYDEASVAYLMVGTALFLQILMPIIVSQYFDLARTASSEASEHLCSNMAQVAWIPGIPGVVLVVLEVLRQFVIRLDEQKLKRKNLKYGQGIVRMEKTRNVFLGNCWSMPYCRDKVRAKCPIFLARRGPCWRTKRGCMCDETIVLAANADWKQNVSAAKQAIEGSAAARPAAPINAGQNLSLAFKKERCRQCVIYNLHQEQKYRALVAVALVAIGFLLFQYSSLLLNEVSVGYHMFDKVASHLSFSSASGDAAAQIPHHKTDDATTPDEVFGSSADLSGPVGWVVLIIVAMIAVSQVLQLIEYVCFKLKI